MPPCALRSEAAPAVVQQEAIKNGVGEAFRTGGQSSAVLGTSRSTGNAAACGEGCSLAVVPVTHVSGHITYMIRFSDKFDQTLTV